MFKTKNTDIPNKCDICGLKIHEAFEDSGKSSPADEFFTKLEKLQELKIVPKGYSRSRNVTIVMGGQDHSSTEFCSIDSNKWNNKYKKCPHWLPGIGLNKEVYLSIYQANKMKALTIRIFWLTVIAVSIAFLSFIYNLYGSSLMDFFKNTKN